MAAPRVSPPRVFPIATGAAKPPLSAAGSADAYRQASFVLGAEVEAVLHGLNLEGAIAEASAGAKFRNQRTASALLMWSRSWLCRLQALHAMQWGNYAAAIPLVRSAADHLAAELALLGAGAEEWQGWLEDGGIASAPADHATEYRLHPFRSAETLAANPAVGRVYRAATDLALPHFGATLLLAGSDSTPERVLATFGDRDFHVALAELALGWLHSLSAEHLRAALASGGAFGLPEGVPIEAEAAKLSALAETPTRCRVEIVERAGAQRYLVHNWRRAPGGAPKRILL